MPLTLVSETITNGAKQAALFIEPCAHKLYWA